MENKPKDSKNGVKIAQNSGEYSQDVCDRNLAENIFRVLYPNDNVRTVVLAAVVLLWHDFYRATAKQTVLLSTFCLCNVVC